MKSNPLSTLDPLALLLILVFNRLVQQPSASLQTEQNEFDPIGALRVCFGLDQPRPSCNSACCSLAHISHVFTPRLAVGVAYP